MKRIGIAFVAVMTMILGLNGFIQHRNHQKQAELEKRDTLKIVTTNSILEDMVNQIVQDKGEVYSIVKRGVDPHEYEPQPEDIAKSNDADLLFHNGLNLETGGNGWFKKLVETAHKEFDKDVFAASKEVTPLHLTTNEAEEDPHAWLDLENGFSYVETMSQFIEEKDPKNNEDPHAWLDLENGISYVETMSQIIQEKDPKNKAFYQKNTEAYVKKLADLHQKAQSMYLEIPENQRLLVTSEGAFKYFSKAYHVNPTYIWEINTEAQGTPEQMETVLSKIRQSKVKHLFVETSVSDKSMKQVAKETGYETSSQRNRFRNLRDNFYRFIS